MDLRMVKTRAQIKEAFLQLREKLMPDKIKVKDICQVTMINKTTFYNHYADSNQLSEEIDNSMIDKILSVFAEKDKIFEDPKAYISGLLAAMEKESGALKRVFRGKREVMCVKLEERLRSFYEKEISDVDDKIKLSFAIGGFVRIVNDYVFGDVKYNVDQLAEATAHIIEAVLQKKAAVTA